MKFGTMLRTGAGVLFTLLAISAQPSAWGQTFTTFDPPGSTGTSPGSINAAGQIAGSYVDSSFATHGFVRDNDGTITSFDVPGAVFVQTIVMTQQGVIVGLYFDDAFNSHIFERAKDGAITNLEFPSPGAFVYAIVVNTAGEIGGGFSDLSGKLNGFVRAPSGKFTLFPIPPALVPSFFAPNITALMQDGTLVGSYIDASFASHGYLLSPDGNLTTFDPPNALPSFFSGPSSVNNSETIAGFFNDGSQNGDLRVFLRAPKGVFSSFDTPELGNHPTAAAINPSGAVAGSVINSVCTNVSCTTTWESFLRTAKGVVKPVNNPQAVPGTQPSQGTGVLGINPSGEMFGIYFDAMGMQHGFVAK
jgi:hypothetical protein